MKKLNNQGFALVETLIVSVFVLGIFTLVYVNYYPLIGEYEKRENYDAIESVYKTNTLKKFIESNGLNFNGSNGSYKYIKYVYAFSDELGVPCDNIWNSLGINSLIITTYNIADVKSNIKNNSSISAGMKEYVEYLPDYKENQYQYNGRIIVEYKETVDESGSSNSYDIYKYATLGVDLHG